VNSTEDSPEDIEAKKDGQWLKSFFYVVKSTLKDLTELK
jgi:hypothetical protein